MHTSEGFQLYREAEEQCYETAGRAVPCALIETTARRGEGGLHRRVLTVSGRALNPAVYIDHPKDE